MLNHIILQGRLTADPVVRFTGTGKPVASFRLAVDRDVKGQNGQRETDFIDCVAWNKTAEFVQQYFKKGSAALVSGRLQMRDWQDREGTKRIAAEVVIDNIYFGESKRSEDKPTPGLPDFKPAFTPLNDDGELPF